MKVPPFTLIHQPDLIVEPGEPGRLPLSLESLHEVAPDLAAPLRTLRPNLTRTILNTHAAVMVTRRSDGTMIFKQKPLPAIKTIGEELQRHRRVVTVGLWDIGSKIGRLPEIIQAINKAQPVFSFFEIQAAIPAGLISLPEGVAVWAKEMLGRPLKKSEREDMLNNVIANDFFSQGELIRKDLGIDYLVGITPSMVAFEEEGAVYWNYFSSYWGRTIVVSTYRVREYAREANRSFEVAVLGIVIAQLLTALNPRLEYHDNRGCLFDFNEEKDTIVKSLKEAMIEKECLNKIQPKYRDAAAALVSALKDWQ